MVPSNPPDPPAQRTEPYGCRGYAGAAGPDQQRAPYTMAALDGVRGYFQGQYFPASSTMLHGQPTKEY